MKYLILASLFFSSCALLRTTEEQPKCFRDSLGGEIFRERYADEKVRILESIEDRRQITVDLASDRYEEKDCTLRDQFKTQH